MQFVNLEKYPLATQLLLACLQDSPTSTQMDLVETATANDWKTALDLSLYHHVAPLVYIHLQKNFNLIKLPDRFDLKFRDTYLTAIKENFLLYASLHEILTALRANEIPVIPLKGIFLAEKVYANVAAWVMGDIDLLVHQEDLTRVLLLLKNEGYSTETPFDIEKEIPLTHSLPPLSGSGFHEIDLHWSLVPPTLPFRINMEQIWQKAGTEEIAEVGTQSLAPEHLLLHLGLHFSYLHRYLSRIFHICDIAQVLRVYQEIIDWNFLADQAQEWGLSKTTYLAVQAAVQLLGVSVDQDKIDLLKPSDYDPQMLGWLVDHLLKSSDFSINLAEFWAPNPISRRLSILFQDVLLPPRIMRQKYPSYGEIGLPLAYLVRLVDVGARQIPGLWRLIRKDPVAQEAVKEIQNIDHVGRWLTS